MILHPSRRLLLAGLAASLALRARAEEVVELRWEDLLPEDERGPAYAMMRELGIVPHGAFDAPETQMMDVRLTDRFNGKRVSLAGFAIPLDYDGTATKTLILAPFVGACIHVPPPPPNQLVLVTAQTPHEVSDLFEPVVATGRFNTMAAETDLAEIGYSLDAERIAPFEG